MASDPAALSPDASGLERDLRAIREKRSVSLDTLQRETRMPGDILNRFEAGGLIGDASYSEVYLRNLLKAYAQALGISPQEVKDAYEKAKAGTYDGRLRSLYLEGGAETSAAPPPPASGTAPAVAALSASAAPRAPVAERTAEHLPKRRVRTAQAAAASSQPIKKSWGLLIGGTVAALLVIGAVLWFLLRDPTPDAELTEVSVPAESETVEPDAAAPVEDPAETPAAPPPPSSAPRFQTPIQVTVAAAAEPLEDFKVQTDDDLRRPYWLDPGAEQTFTGQQRVIVSGEGGVGNYDGATLRLQGIEWTPREGQVFRITAADGQAFLDSLARVAR